MTEIIDSISFSHNLNPRHPLKNYRQFRTHEINAQSSFASDQRQQTNKNTFLIHGKSTEHDLLFNLDYTETYLTIRVYVFTKFGQILKISSQNSRAQLIRRFSSSNSLYQPKINPLNGFIYFQFSVLYQKLHFKFQQSLRIPQLLRQINFEKLFISLQNLWPSQDIFQLEKAQKQFSSEVHLSQPIFKVVSGTFLNSDLQKFVLNLSKPFINSVVTFKNDVQEFYHLLQSSKYHSTSLSPLKVKKTLKDIESLQLSLNNLLKRKGVKSNYDTLLINAEAEKNLKELMIKMMEEKFSKQLMKVQEAELGKVTLDLQRVEDKKFRNKLIFLQSLPKMCEYHFIDKYYRPPLNFPILISLSLKEQSLHHYLIKNAAIMSLETKMRILIQIYSGINILWEESKLIYYVGNLKKTFVTKNLGIKLRGTDNFFKPQKHMLLEDKNFVNQKLAQSLLNLSQLYFKVFHQQNPFYAKPTADYLFQRSFLQYCRSSKALEKVCMNKYLPNLTNDNNKRYISSLNYLFIEQMNVARKIIQESQQKRRPYKLQVWSVEGSQKQQPSVNMEQNENQRLISTKMAACWLLSAYY